MQLGQEVGYQLRFENAIRGATKIRYVTVGILLRRMLGDHQLKGVSALVFDGNNFSSNYDSREVNATVHKSSPFSIATASAATWEICPCFSPEFKV